eukprot:scaffold5359_cov265-Pinguiococcus_pyrenoidosus.AAC.2
MAEGVLCMPDVLCSAHLQPKERNRLKIQRPTKENAFRLAIAGFGVRAMRVVRVVRVDRPSVRAAVALTHLEQLLVEDFRDIRPDAPAKAPYISAGPFSLHHVKEGQELGQREHLDEGDDWEVEERKQRQAGNHWILNDEHQDGIVRVVNEGHANHARQRHDDHQSRRHLVREHPLNLRGSAPQRAWSIISQRQPPRSYVLLPRVQQLVDVRPHGRLQHLVEADVSAAQESLRLVQVHLSIHRLFLSAPALVVGTFRRWHEVSWAKLFANLPVS